MRDWGGHDSVPGLGRGGKMRDEGRRVGVREEGPSRESSRGCWLWNYDKGYIPADEAGGRGCINRESGRRSGIGVKAEDSNVEDRVN
jgi:hypothetical protein